MAKLLIYDDDLETRPALEQSLTRKHETVFVDTAEDAVKRLNEEKFDLVLASICHEQQSVLALVQKAKTAFLLNKIPFVLYRGPDAPDLEPLDDTVGMAMMALGARAFIGADDYDMLLKKVDEFLRTQRKESPRPPKRGARSR